MLQIVALGVALLYGAGLVIASDGGAIISHDAQSSVTGPLTTGTLCQKITNNSASGAELYVPTATAAEWQSFRDHPPAGVSLASCAAGITVPCTTNVNLYTLAGSPSSAGTYNFTIPTGCVVGSNSTAQPALTTGTWPAGSAVTLVNDGSVYGKEGSTSQSGGDAMWLGTDIVIDNTNGEIFGGGGGGGGGGSGYWTGGGIGGAGQGYGNQSGPTAGTAGGTFAYYVQNGIQEEDRWLRAQGGTGGTGGQWGVIGAGGGAGWSQDGGSEWTTPGGPGGAAGNAIALNGKSVTWLGGHTLARVKGIPAPVQCNDGIDNDSSGLVDMVDTCGCSSLADDSEAYDVNMCGYGSTVICTELHRQGLMPDAWMEADAAFGAKMPAVVMNGYHLWAKPVVALMQRSHAFTMFVNSIAQPWAQEMAYLEGVEEHGSFAGLIVMIFGIPFSALLGIFVTWWW